MFSRYLPAVLLLACTTTHAMTVTIALGGATVPDGNGSYFFFTTPDLNDAGTTAFRATLTGTSGGSTDDSGIFRGSGGTLTRIARAGQAAPDGNGSFMDFSPPTLNDADSVAFVAGLTGTSGGSTDDAGVFRGSGGTLTRIARKGQAAPDGNGTFDIFGAPTLNGAGTAAFQASLTGTSGGSTDNTGIFRGNGGALTQIVRMGQIPPDGNGSFDGFGYLPPAINDTGTVAFWAFLTATTGGSVDNSGLFRSSSGVVSRVARAGQAAPDGNGSFSSFSTTPPALNDAGTAAFWATLTGTSGGSTDDSGIFQSDGGTLTRIAREGQAAPDGNGRFSGFPLTVTLNHAGTVAFWASLTGTSGGPNDNSGLFRSSGGTMTQIARAGQAVPDGNGLFSFLDSFPRINDAGAVAFWSGLTDTSGGPLDDGGIYLGDGQDLVRAAREGDFLEGSTIVSLNLEETGLNRHGQVAYRADLADGREALFLFTPELHWRSTLSDAWDSAPWDNPDARNNWTLSLVPARVHDVIIDPVVSLTVYGPPAPTTVNSLVIGGGTGVATLTLDGGNLTTTNGTSIAPTGVLTGDGVLSGNVTNFGEVRAHNVTINSGNLLNQGQIRGVGSGPNRINATVINQATGEIRLNSGESLRLTRGGHANDGRVSVTGAELEVDGDFTNNAAGRIQGRDAIYRFTGGLANSGQLQLTFGTSDLFGAITNHATGSVINSGGGNVTFYDPIRNDGELRTSTGSRSVFFGNYTGTGVLTGAGANFFEGGFSPGASPFMATASTDVSFGFTNVSLIELAGSTRGVGSASEYDGLDVTGGKSLTLGGTLKVVLIDDITVGYTPDPGDIFLIFTAAQILGAFHTIDLPALASGLDWLVSNDGQNFSLAVKAVPLPPGLWLMVGALLGLGVLGRRRGS